VLHVACCMLPPGAHALEASSYRMHAHARATCTRGRSCRYGRGRLGGSGAKPRSPCALTVNWPQLPRHTLCTAAAPHPSLKSAAGLQLEKIAAAGNAAEKALLADVTEEHWDASYIDLLRLFKVRRSVADGHS
jgi:hypothetical protein